MKSNKTLLISKIGVIALAIMASGADAQDENPQELEEVVVTGYRGSLQTSTEAKRESIGVVDEIFADDIGKMPSQNLAESLSRIPGVKINREVTGEGQQIAVRGLGPSFTKVVMNGNSIAVASDGSMGTGSRGRHVDLDMFPSELFSSLAVNKTAAANQIEGGVSGYVNMRTLRASDLGEGGNFRFGLEAAYNEMSGSTSPKYHLLYGYSTDTFGILAGFVVKNSETRVDGYETVGNYQSGCAAEWVDVNTRDCVAGSTGWNVFHYGSVASADYAAAHAGVNVGDPIDINAVSGLTDAQLDTFGMPYIGRAMYTTGDRDTTSAIIALEYNPNDNVKLALDVLHSKADRNFLRNEAMNIYRRNYIQYGLEWIPENVTVSGDNVIQSGTFYNNRVWVGSREYEEELTYTSINPSLSWNISDAWQMDVSWATTDSEFDRDEPYLLYYSPAGTMYHAYDGDFPTIQHSANIARAGAGWTFGAGPGIMGNELQAGSFRFQRAGRDTETTSFNVDFAFGEDADTNGIKFGLALDENSANMVNFSGGDAWNDLVTNSNLNTFGNYLVDSPVTDLGNSVSGYNGLNGIASINWDAVKRDLNYDSFQPEVATGGDYFGQVVGDIDEDIRAFYIEANTESDIIGHTMRTNTGVRYVETEQQVSSTPTDATNTDYSRILPSFSAVFDLTEDIKLRGSASKSFTRANPASMFPNTSWGSSSIDSVNAGNPFLQPFESINFDFGGEWYFGELGAYVGVTLYEKDITGFTRQEQIQVQFLELANYGLDISNAALSATQLDAIAACGGRDSDSCVSTITTDVNIDGTTKLYGWEAIWVMPLDMLVDGLGFNVSMNNINQDSTDADAEIPGISDSVNFTAYYENSTFQTRVTYTSTEKTETFGGWSPLFSADREQIDLSASYNLPTVGGFDLTLTFDAYNLTNEPIRSYFESDGNTFNVMYPGATYTLGIRGSY